MLFLLLPWIDSHSAHPGRDGIALWIFVLVGSAFILVPTLLGAVWLVRARIIADETGVRWRSLGRERSAPWDAVADYYERLAPKKSSPVPIVIETSAGRLKCDSAWSNCNALQDLVLREATKARTKGWGVFGMRPDNDWPRVFNYEPQKNKRAIVAMAIAVVILLILLVLADRPSLRDYGSAAFSWDLAGVGLLALPMIAYISTLYFAGIRQYQAVLLRASQRIIVDLDGMTLQDHDREIRLNWSEITDYRLAGTEQITSLRRYVVTGEYGEIEVLPTLRDVGLLTKIVSQFAVNTEAREWRYRKSDTLGGSASCWSGRCEGVGERIFHYRTRVNRALLGFLGIMAAMPLSSAWLHRRLEMPVRDDASFVATMSVALGGAFLWSIWRYSSAHIQIDVHGITQFTPFGKRFLAWQDVNDFCQSGGDIFVFYNVIGTDGRRVRFWWGIGDCEELKVEIAKHRPALAAAEEKIEQHGQHNANNYASDNREIESEFAAMSHDIAWHSRQAESVPENNANADQGNQRSQRD